MFRKQIIGLVFICTICFNSGCSSETPSNDVADDGNPEAPENAPIDASQDQQANANQQNEETEAYDVIKAMYAVMQQRGQQIYSLQPTADRRSTLVRWQFIDLVVTKTNVLTHPFEAKIIYSTEFWWPENGGEWRKISSTGAQYRWHDLLNKWVYESQLDSKRQVVTDSRLPPKYPLNDQYWPEMAGKYTGRFPPASFPPETKPMPEIVTSDSQYDDLASSFLKSTTWEELLKTIPVSQVDRLTQFLPADTLKGPLPFRFVADTNGMGGMEGMGGMVGMVGMGADLPAENQNTVPSSCTVVFHGKDSILIKCPKSFFGTETTRTLADVNRPPQLLIEIGYLQIMDGDVRPKVNLYTALSKFPGYKRIAPSMLSQWQPIISHSNVDSIQATYEDELAFDWDALASTFELIRDRITSAHEYTYSQKNGVLVFNTRSPSGVKRAMDGMNGGAMGGMMGGANGGVGQVEIEEQFASDSHGGFFSIHPGTTVSDADAPVFFLGSNSRLYRNNDAIVSSDTDPNVRERILQMFGGLVTEDFQAPLDSLPKDPYPIHQYPVNCDVVSLNELQKKIVLRDVPILHELLLDPLGLDHMVGMGMSDSGGMGGMMGGMEGMMGGMGEMMGGSVGSKWLSDESDAANDSETPPSKTLYFEPSVPKLSPKNWKVFNADYALFCFPLDIVSQTQTLMAPIGKRYNTLLATLFSVSRDNDMSWESTHLNSLPSNDAAIVKHAFQEWFNLPIDWNSDTQKRTVLPSEGLSIFRVSSDPRTRADGSRRNLATLAIPYRTYHTGSSTLLINGLDRSSPNSRFTSIPPDPLFQLLVTFNIRGHFVYFHQDRKPNATVDGPGFHVTFVHDKPLVIDANDKSLQIEIQKHALYINRMARSLRNRKDLPGFPGGMGGMGGMDKIEIDRVQLIKDLAINIVREQWRLCFIVDAIEIVERDKLPVVITTKQNTDISPQIPEYAEKRLWGSNKTEAQLIGWRKTIDATVLEFRMPDGKTHVSNLRDMTLTTDELKMLREQAQIR